MPMESSNGRTWAVALMAGLALVALSGCSKRLTSCKQDNKDYAGAQELPPLKAPEGLEAPDTRNALKIPPLKTPERTRGRDEPCLDVPPAYSSKATAPTPATPPKKPREVSSE